jgi:hypothetical protein
LLIGRVFAAQRESSSDHGIVQAVMDVSQCVDGTSALVECANQQLLPTKCSIIDQAILFNRYNIEDSPSPPIQPKKIDNDIKAKAAQTLKDEKETQRAEKLRQIQLKVEALKQRKAAS